MSDDTQTTGAADQMLPPPSDFRLFIQGFVGQAMMAMGKVPNPMTGETKVELPWASYFIDLIAMLDEKTSGNLSREEASFLESQLEMLRLTYVETAKEEGQLEGNGKGSEPTASED